MALAAKNLAVTHQVAVDGGIKGFAAMGTVHTMSTNGLRFVNLTLFLVYNKDRRCKDEFKF